MIIAPSILAADFSSLGEEVSQVMRAGADWVHIDVMDGAFVPNITMGPVVVKSIRPRTSAVFDVHLMIDAPERYVDAFADAGADLITVHMESTPHVQRAVQMIKQRGKMVGVAVNPGTSLDGIRYLLDDIDLVLIMTINPGFGGQKLIPSMIHKVREARVLLNESGHSNVHVEVDGGIDPVTAPHVIQAGADVLVAGTAIFGSSDYAAAIRSLRSLA